jgi:hypothetical protein
MAVTQGADLQHVHVCCSRTSPLCITTTRSNVIAGRSILARCT